MTTSYTIIPFFLFLSFLTVCTKCWLRRYNKKKKHCPFDYIGPSSFRSKGFLKTNHRSPDCKDKDFTVGWPHSQCGNSTLKHFLREWVTSVRELKRKCFLYLLMTELSQKERKAFCSVELADWHLVQIEDAFKKFCYPCGWQRHQFNKKRELLYAYISISSLWIWNMM